MTRISRRQFLKKSAAVSLGVICAACGLDIPASSNNERQTQEPEPHKDLLMNNNNETLVALLGVKKGADTLHLAEAVKEAAQMVTNFSWLSRGDTVLIKPALNSGNPYPATTSPEAVSAMVELLFTKGAGRVIVSDMSGIEHVKLTQDKLDGSSRQLMTNSGMAKAAIDAGAELYFPEEAGWDAFYEEDPIDSTYWKQGIMMPKILLEVDHIVCMPRCSRHPLFGSSLGLKSTVGYWRTDSRLVYHKSASSIQEMTADANTVKSLREKQRLVLTATTKVLNTMGPDSGFISEPDTGLVIASESIVAHDMVSLAWLLHNRSEMSDKDIAVSRDPYNNQFIVNNVNRFVVKRLGSIADALQAEKLTRNDIDAIWQDRVLNRAYEIFGGVPRIQFVGAHESVPSELAMRLLKMVTYPS